ncbi:MAG TPA: helix-turn-helix domain-containing protein [Solirubrobacteraceae bacterium]
MTTGLTTRPWEGLDAGIARALRPELDGLADEIIDTIVLDVAEYRRPLEGGFERGLRTGVHEALRHFVQLIEDPVAGRTQDRSVYRGLGRGELRQGRSLDALQAAYRIGARVAWRRWADAGNEAGLDAAALQLLAESIFVYIDELSAESVEGYAAAQAERAGERERRRQRLFAALVSEPVDEETVRAAAAAAGWTVPRSLAAVAISGTGGAHVAGALGEDAIAVVDGAETLVLWPDPQRPGARALLARELRREAAIGPAVSWRQAGRSLRLARTLLELGRRDGAPAEPRWVSDHLRAIALDDPDGVLSELRSTRLRAFEGLSERARERLEQTLLGWLKEQGNRAAAARALGVHEQTVRYRMNQLRELLGDALDDPDARFELELALRAGERG